MSDPTVYTNSILPKYKCHKVVKGAEIISIRPVADTPKTILTLKQDHVNVVELLVETTLVEKHNPAVGWFVVIYKDGYISFSPGDAFIDGYAPV